MPKDIKSVETEVMKHRAAIVRLQIHRNSLLPVAKLPAELLGEIFLSNLFASGVEDFAYPAKLDSRPCWIDVSHVSHRWREVALHTPRLWSYVGTDNPGWLEASISRSKAVPLHVRIKRPTTSPLLLGFRDIGARNRIQELHLTAVLGPWIHLLDESQNTPTSEHPPSIITSFRLHAIASYNGPDTLRFPKSFALRSFPHLTTLELVGCEIDWRNPLFKSAALTYLKIVTMDSNSVLPALRTILPSLNRLVGLELGDLGFGQAFPEEDQAAVVDISLPCIKHLTLIGHHPLKIAASINTIGRCDSIRIRLLCRIIPWQSRGNEASELDSLITPFFSRYYSELPDPPTIQHLSLISRLSSYAVECTHEPRSGTASSCFMTTTWREHVYADFLFTTEICEELPLSRLRSLRLDTVQLYSQSWLEIFPKMEGLEELFVTGTGATAGIVEALNPKERSTAQSSGVELPVPVEGDSTSGLSPGSVDSDAIVCPHLHRLEFLNPVFNRENTFHDLQQCLAERKRCKSGLKTLVLSGCRNLAATDVESCIASGVVGDVQWDGKIFPARKVRPASLMYDWEESYGAGTSDDDIDLIGADIYSGMYGDSDEGSEGEYGLDNYEYCEYITRPCNFLKADSICEGNHSAS